MVYSRHGSQALHLSKRYIRPGTDLQRATPISSRAWRLMMWRSAEDGRWRGDQRVVGLLPADWTNLPGESRPEKMVWFSARLDPD